LQQSLGEVGVQEVCCISSAKTHRRCKGKKAAEVVDLVLRMPSRQILLQYKIHHAVFWIFFSLVWYYLRYQDYATWQLAALVTAIKVVDLMLLVYIVNYVLIPKLLYRKKYGVFVLLLLLMIAVSSSLKMYILGTVLNNPALYHWTNQIKARIYDNIIPHIFLVIAGMAVKLLIDYNKAQNRLLQVAKEKAETELDFLKAQINPHFLFNSINAVYFLIDKNNTEAREALHKFSDMLRHQLYGVKDQKIALEKEVGYLQDYIGLQQLRNDNCEVQVQVEPAVKEVLIEPFLLLPFVENSFKHLSHFSNGKKNEIKITLQRQNGEVEFSVLNTTESKEEPAKEGGIGLANVKRRLELLYPQKHQLQVSGQDGWFVVYLKLKIENNGTDPLHTD
jgi:two-component system, LytTR family, sensor kinase